MDKDKRILIVARDTDFLNELANFLLADGYRNVKLASSYSDVLSMIKRIRFDVILMDIFAPALKGMNYAQEIKRMIPETRVFLMIEPEHQKQIKGEVLNKVKCLLKPFVKQYLLTSISEL